MKNFTDVFETIKAEVEGKTAKTFSRTDFDKLAKAFVNSPNYTTEHVALKKGELVKDTVEPVKEFRGMIKTVLEDFGVDKSESVKMMEDYEFKNAKALYNFVSEMIYTYMKAGKKFDFITKEDFIGSMIIEEENAAVTEHVNPRDPKGDKIKVKKEKHFKLKAKAKCPEWRKSNI